MKKLQTLSPALLLLLIFMTGCSKKTSEVTTPAASTITDPSPFLSSGTWAITSYTQRTENKTSSFNGYTFVFKPGGVLEATVNGTSSTGSWVFTPAAVTYYGSGGSNASVSLSIGTATPLNRLNRRWNIDSVRTTASRLALINPEPRDDERLDFSKQ
jgi:hypothetical protein